MHVSRSDAPAAVVLISFCRQLPVGAVKQNCFLNLRITTVVSEQAFLSDHGFIGIAKYQESPIGKFCVPIVFYDCCLEDD
jgi:hypothetical protein